MINDEIQMRNDESPDLSAVARRAKEEGATENRPGQPALSAVEGSALVKE